MHTIKIFAIALIALASSCSSVKKTQHTVNEFSKVLDKEKKDSSQVVKVEEQKGISEQEKNTKKIDIIFPDQPDQPTNVNDYFTLTGNDSIFNLLPTWKKIKTNRPAAVTIKNNGDIQLNTAPKSITITENQDKTKIDTGSKITTSQTNLNTEKEHTADTGKKEVDNSKKSTRLFSMWWLLVLLLIPGIWAYRKYIKPIAKLTEPIKWT